MNRKDELAKLDALLNSESQQVVQRAVQALPEDSLSLSWRSELNEQLRNARQVSRWRQRFAAAWRPGLALALTGCLAIMLVFRTTPESAQSHSNLEASLVSVYFDTANSDEVAGSGLAMHEVNDTTQSTETSSDWEVDLNNL
jgi:hypothetical protein